MKGLYCFRDARTGLSGEPISFDNDRYAKEAFIRTLASLPANLVDDSALYRVADYDDTDGLPVITGIVPIVVVRGSEKYVQDRIDEIHEASATASV